MSAEPDALRRERLCVFCRTRPVAPEWRPFCSERCKLQDLARWADGAYRVPGEPDAKPDDHDPEAE
jgi:endogenous inhibitor of DNA gyrase (YacG/DUF329 family)